jgi:hypothetical protein
LRVACNNNDKFVALTARIVKIDYRWPAGDPDKARTVSAVGPTQLLQRLLEHSGIRLRARIVRAALEHPDAPHPLALLRLRRERPHRRTAEQRDEIPSPHRSILRSRTAP